MIEPCMDQITIINDLRLAQPFTREVRNGEEIFCFEEEEFSTTNIRRVTMVNIRLRTVESTNFPFLNLTYLNLSFNRISEIHGIAHLIRLQSLDVSHNRIFDLSPLSKMSVLEVLRIENNAIECIGSISRCHKIRELLFGNNSIPWEDVAFLEGMTELEIINLSSNPLEKKPKIFEFLHAFKPTVRLINGTNTDILLNTMRDSSDVKGDLSATALNTDFMRSPDGKVMMARIRAHSKKYFEKVS